MKICLIGDKGAEPNEGMRNISRQYIKEYTFFRILTKILLSLFAAFIMSLVALYITVCEIGFLPIKLKRIISIENFCETRQPQYPGDIFFLGSSVTQEGIDARIVEMFSVKRQAFNLAWQGAQIREWILLLPALERSRPSVVVLNIDLQNYPQFEPQSIDREVLASAAYWNFRGSKVVAQGGPFRNSELKILRNPRIFHLLRFRGLLLSALDFNLREKINKNLRYKGYVENMKSPWVRKTSISKAAMTKGLFEKLRFYEALDPGPSLFEDSLDSLRGIVHYLCSKGISVFVVLTPVHPGLMSSHVHRLIEGVRLSLSGFCSEYGVEFSDCSEWLLADDFSDLTHPSALGREKWSFRIAKLLRLGEN